MGSTGCARGSPTISLTSDKGYSAGANNNAYHVSTPALNMMTKALAIELSPGMPVTVGVKTGRRWVIELFLSPIIRYSKMRLTGILGIPVFSSHFAAAFATQFSIVFLKYGNV